MSTLVTLAQLKAHLNWRNGNAQDTELLLHLDAAELACLGRCSPLLLPTPMPTPAPADLVLAVLITAQHLWTTQTGVGGLRSEPDDTVVIGAAYALPNKAVELLQSYIIPGVA